MLLMMAIAVLVLSSEYVADQEASQDNELATKTEPVLPLPRAHAHNDYLHDRPLEDALQNGFCSVEADIYLVEGQLLVAHTFLELDSKKTLRKLYLDPLRKRVKQNSGQVYPGGPEFTLLIDIKNNGAKTFKALHKLLAEYPEVFSSVEAGKLSKKAVRAIVSGDRAVDVITKTSPRYAGIDGRLSDLTGSQPAHLMPLISDNWRNHFRWRGQGEIPQAEKDRLAAMVAKTHANGQRIRFWAIPDKPVVWKVMNDAGVDLINTDNLSGLRQFLSAQSE